MTVNKMYSQRAKNIPVFRGCSFNCVYCSFKRLIQMNKKCLDCAEFKPHSHIEVLSRKPPKPLPNSFISIGLSSDVSFMSLDDFWQVLEYCKQWSDRTFLIQSKNPEYFLQFNHYYFSKISKSNISAIPDNVILGTTIESNYTTFRNQDYDVGEHNPREFTTYKKCGTGRFKHISEAPLPQNRYAAMLKLTCRKAVTIEPILSFDENVLVEWILKIQPEFVYVGYNSKKGLRLPEPSLSDTLKFIHRLRDNGIEVREKLLRKAFYE